LGVGDPESPAAAIPLVASNIKPITAGDRGNPTRSLPDLPAEVLPILPGPEKNDPVGQIRKYRFSVNPTKI